ncbi:MULTISPECIES: hypothetical protein [Streptomyces]|uniref:hypothetical protein n=1 Tax=Streptomyces TaxID=1883 RepID=UPI002FCD1EF9
MPRSNRSRTRLTSGATVDFFCNARVARPGWSHVHVTKDGYDPTDRSPGTTWRTGPTSFTGLAAYGRSGRTRWRCTPGPRAGRARGCGPPGWSVACVDAVMCDNVVYSVCT